MRMTPKGVPAQSILHSTTGRGPATNNAAIIAAINTAESMPRPALPWPIGYPSRFVLRQQRKDPQPPPLSTPLSADIPADMTDEELTISRSTPSAQFGV